MFLASQFLICNFLENKELDIDVSIVLSYMWRC